MFEKIKSTVQALVSGPEKKPAAPVEVKPAIASKKTGDDIITEELKVWQVPSLNHKIVVCYLPEKDPTNPVNLVSVNVRANWNFMKGMKVKAKKSGFNVYDLVGPLPRWKGRW